MEKKAYLKILIAASLWGGLGVFVQVLSSAGLTSMQSVSVRNLIAAGVLCLHMLLRDRSALKIDPRHWYYFFGSGVCALFMFNWCYFRTIAASSMSVAAVLLYTSPIFVVVMSAVLFKEAVTPQKLLALGITLVGCVLATGLFPMGQTNLSAGIILQGMGAGFGFALYSVLSKIILKKYSSTTVTFYTLLFCGLFSLPISGLHTRVDLLTNGTFWLGAVGLGVLCCALPSFLFTDGMIYAEAGKASILSTAELLVASALGILVYHDEVTPLKLLGMAAIFGAILLLNWRPKGQK